MKLLHLLAIATLMTLSAHANGNDFITPAILEASAPPFNRPFENAPGEAITANGFTVHRPNHGIVQGARVAALFQDLIQMTLNKQTQSPLQTWLRERIKSDPQFLQKISLMALIHRSGRTDESDSINIPEKRVNELATSASNFEKAAAPAGLKFTPKDLEDFKAAINLDGKSNANPDQSHLSRLLRGAHVVDLIRLGIKLDESMLQILPELDANDIKKSYERANNYIQLTGSRPYADKFFELSKDMKQLHHVLTKAQTAGWEDQKSSGNCELQDLVGNGKKYQAVVKFEFTKSSGEQGVKYVRIFTSELHATDADLFRQTEWQQGSSTNVTRTVLHGPTIEKLDDLVSPKACKDWNTSNSQKPKIQKKIY